MCTNLTIARHSQCPADDWKASVAPVLVHDDMSYLNIGANKGYNILEYLLRHDVGAYPTMKYWHKQLLDMGVDQHACGVCKSCKSTVSRARRLGNVRRIVAVELLTNNYEILRQLCKAHIPHAHVIHAAAVRRRSSPAYEPALRHRGHETLGISKRGRRVSTITLDEVINGSTWDMVSIDAEGWDGEILRGGTSSIMNRDIRLIEFEYSGKWITRLVDTVHWLSRAGYNCYWTGNNGRLAEVSPTCPDIEIHQWSNIVCTHENSLDQALKHHLG